MKIAVLLAYAVLTCREVTSAAIQSQLNPISLEDIIELDRRHFEYLNNHYSNSPRTRRSSDESLHSLKSSIGQSIKSKLGLLAKGSASASGSLSSGSSGKYSYHHHDVHSDHDHHKSFDFWSLKKSILNTLLQAVKAIKGGVIAIKGQLIKGSGYLISAKGKLISAKGEAITKLGKNIATSAVLSPTHGHSEDYHASFHHTSPEEYGSPSAPGPEYDFPEHHYHHHPPLHEDKPESDHHGILILKKIPVHHDHSSEHLPLEHKVPDFKHLKEHKGPSIGEIIGKFFSASTSLKPGYPAPFGDDDEHHHYKDFDSHKHPDSHDHHEHPVHESYYDHHSSHDEEYHAPHSSHDEKYHEPHSSHHDNDHEYSSPVHLTSKEKPSSSNLFEKAPSYLNLDEYTSETKPAPEIKPTPQPLQHTTPIKYDEIRPLPIKYDEVRPLSTSFSNIGFDSTAQLTNFGKLNLYHDSFSDNPNMNFPSLSVSLPAIQPSPLVSNTQFGAFPNPGSHSSLQYLAPPDVGPQVFPRKNLENPHPQTYPASVKYHGYLDSLQASNHKRPTRSKHHSSRKRPVFPSPSFMKTLSKLAANGAKRV